MGKKPIDEWTKKHALMGGISYLCLKSVKLSSVQNFFIAQTIHGIIEIIEKTENKKFNTVESRVNHISDIIAFYIGWNVSYIVFRNVEVCTEIMVILWVYLLVTFYWEIKREI